MGTHVGSGISVISITPPSNGLNWISAGISVILYGGRSVKGSSVALVDDTGKMNNCVTALVQLTHDNKK